jgi:hypothetical protein
VRYPGEKVFLPLKDTLIEVNMPENHPHVLLSNLSGRIISPNSLSRLFFLDFVI